MGYLLLLFLGLGLLRGKKKPQELPEEPPIAEQCTATRRDGPYAICLTMVKAGIVGAAPAQWTWSAALEDVAIVPDGVAELPNELTDDVIYPNRDAALAEGAWRRLAHDVPDYGANLIVPLPISRWGLTLNINGVVTVDNVANYVNHASQIIAGAQQDGDDAAGIVAAVLIDAFGENWNPLRVKIAGGTIFDAAARLAAVPQNPPQQARALMGI